MSFICPICKELLVAAKDQQEDAADIIVTTKCGHLFHNSCLNRFFEEKLEREGHESSPTLAKSFCPSCQRVVLTKNTIQLYPAEDDNDPFGKLMTRCNALIRQNEELKKANEKLTSEIDELRQLKGVRKPEFISGGLSVNDQILWFPDTVNEDGECKPEAGVAKWIGRMNEVLYAGIEFENPIGNEVYKAADEALFPCKPKHRKFVPVNELILYSDFLSPISKSESKENTKTLLNLNKEQGRESQSKLEKINAFEAHLNEFILLQEVASVEYKTLQDELTRLLAEEIIAVPSNIEDQLKRATELRSELLAKEKFLTELKKLSVEVLQFEDITTQETAILQEGITSLELMRDNAKQTLSRFQFHKALGHSQKIKSFLQGGFRWLNELESQFNKLMDSYNLVDTPKLHIVDVLEMKNELEFRQPQLQHLEASFNFFQSPGFKLKRPDQSTLKTVLDSFEELKLRKCALNNILLKDANRIFRVVDDWAMEIHVALETEFGPILLVKLLELATHEERIRQEIPKLVELANALAKDSEVNELDQLSLNVETTKSRLESISEELHAEIKQLTTKPALPKAYY